jgi:hypothetical protein
MGGCRSMMLVGAGKPSCGKGIASWTLPTDYCLICCLCLWDLCVQNIAAPREENNMCPSFALGSNHVPWWQMQSLNSVEVLNERNDKNLHDAGPEQGILFIPSSYRLFLVDPLLLVRYSAFEAIFLSIFCFECFATAITKGKRKAQTLMSFRRVPIV